MKHYGPIAVNGLRSDTPGDVQIQHENVADAILWGWRQDTSGGLRLDRYSSGWTEAFRFNDNKVVVLQAGVNFPSAQNASANANTLDDYEEGSWTMSLNGQTSGGFNITTQVCKYIKIGKSVVCWFAMSGGTNNSLTGAWLLQGLPFTSGTFTGVNPAQGGHLITYRLFPTSTNAIGISIGIVSGTTTGRFYWQYMDGTETTQITGTPSASLEMAGILTYEASN